MPIDERNLNPGSPDSEATVQPSEPQPVSNQSIYEVVVVDAAAC